MKKFLALSLALFLFLSLFGACSINPPDDTAGLPDDGASAGSATDDTDNAGDHADQPREYDEKHIEWMGVEVHQWKYDFVDAEHFNSWQSLMQLMLEQYNLVEEVTIVDGESYSTTLNGLLAADDLPDCFQMRFDTSTFCSAVENGKLADMDEVLAYSDGTAYNVYHDEDKNLREKAMMMYGDHWYCWSISNNNGTMLEFGGNAPMQAANGLYSTNIRKDWLDKLGLPVPQTLDEFEQALLAFQENDVNENGSPDERYYCGLGNQWATQGIGSYFGLNYSRFIENAKTGEIECPELMPGYEHWVQYMSKLYNSQTVLIEGSHPWLYAPTVGGNCVGAAWLVANVLQNCATGDSDSYYTPMPVIQAVEGIQPMIVAQEAVASNGKVSYSSRVDLDAAARFCDFLNGKDFYYYFFYGTPGIAWDFTEDGTSIVQYPCDDEDAPMYSTFLSNNGCPNPTNGNLYDVNRIIYPDVQSALDAGEPYTYGFTTKEQFADEYGYENPMELNLELIAGLDTEYYVVGNYYSFASMPTQEEAELFSMYENDLTTFLNEMTTGLIVGTYSVDQIDELRQQMYDSLYLQEYIDNKQAAVNRYREEMGLDPVIFE